MRAVLFTALLALAPSPAAAEPLVDAARPAEITNIARGSGSAVLEADGAGDPMIRGRIDGTQYVVHFYGCTDGADCRTIQLRAGWLSEGLPLAAINAWNRERRFGKAYIDALGRPVIEMNLNLAHGVSVANLDETFAWWSAVLAQFAEHLDAATAADDGTSPGKPEDATGEASRESWPAKDPR